MGQQGRRAAMNGRDGETGKHEGARMEKQGWVGREVEQG